MLNGRDAIKTIKKSGIIVIYLNQADNIANIEIKDDGIGIPEERLSKIFDPFFTTKDVGGGTGLGLSICQAIVEKYNGSISVGSKLGKGTTFKIQFPAILIYARQSWRD